MGLQSPDESNKMSVYNISEIVSQSEVESFSNQKSVNSMRKYPMNLFANTPTIPMAMSKIDILKEEEPEYPAEKIKALYAGLIVLSSFFITACSLAILHEKLPDRTIYKPLPDIFLDNIKEFNWAFDLSDIFLTVAIHSTTLILLFHKHRFIIMRRYFLMIAALYLMRAVTMFVTILPTATTTYYCSPKLEEPLTILIVLKRAVSLYSGFGLSMYGKHVYCGDSIYSGHTVFSVIAYLLAKEYTTNRFYIAHWLLFLNGLIVVGLVFVSHAHYTIDIIIGYYVATRLFWTVHTLTNNSVLMFSDSNYFSGAYWFRAFCYFEKNTPRQKLPNLFDWPLPWPRKFSLKSAES